MHNFDLSTHSPSDQVDGYDEDPPKTSSVTALQGKRNTYGTNPHLAGINTPITGIGESSRIQVLDNHGLGWPGEHRFLRTH
jgi:hypothetical protein